MEWSIQDLARLVGTTSRALRHYDDLGLLRPCRKGANGYRYYDEDGLLRLQRILLLKNLGLSLHVIADVLDGHTDDAVTLRGHLDLLELERRQLERRIASVQATLRAVEGGEHLMAEQMFDGFDHTRHEEEVTRRWGAEAYRRSDAWWRSLSDADRAAFQQQQWQIAHDFAVARQADLPVDGREAQAIAQRQFDWLSITGPPSRERFTALGEMYVADPRFAAGYDRHGAGTAEYVRDAMRVYADTVLGG